MKISALAMDYDGTIAHHGVVDDAMHTALVRARAGGLRLLLVTGRPLPDVHAIFPRWDVLDRIVAENGAVLFETATGKKRTLSAAPPPAFLDRLKASGIPIFPGESVVATYKPHDVVLRQTIDDLHLDWHLIYNNDAVMALPSGVGKASGLRTALADLNLFAEQCAAVGDAENDIEMLAMAGFPVAVGNALDSVKAAARWVTPGQRGAGVAQLIERLLCE